MTRRDPRELGALLERLDAAFAAADDPPTTAQQGDIDAVRAGIKTWYEAQKKPVPAGMLDPPRRPRDARRDQAMAVVRDWLSVARPARIATKPIATLPRIPRPATPTGQARLSFTLSLALLLTIVEASFGRHIAFWKLPIIFVLMCFAPAILLLAEFCGRELFKTVDPASKGIGWAFLALVALGFIAQIIGPDLLALGAWMGKSGD